MAAKSKQSTKPDWDGRADDLTFAKLERVSEEFLALTAADVQHSLRNPTQVGLVKFESMVELLALRAATPRHDAKEAWRRLRNYLTAVVDLSDRARAAMQKGELIARNPLTATPLPPPPHPRRYIERELIRAIMELRARDVIETLDRMELPGLRKDRSEPRVVIPGAEVFVWTDEFKQWAISTGIANPSDIASIEARSVRAPRDSTRTTPANWIATVRRCADEIARADAKGGLKVVKASIAKRIAQDGISGVHGKTLTYATILRQALKDWEPPD